MFHVYFFFNLIKFLVLYNPSSTFNALSSEGRVVRLQCRILQFSRLLNPDWSIQILCAPAVCYEGDIAKNKSGAPQLFGCG